VFHSALQWSAASIMRGDVTGNVRPQHSLAHLLRVSPPVCMAVSPAWLQGKSLKKGCDK
jgi:hypothetical protein